VIVDFSGLAGERVELNNAGLPKSVANPAPPLSTLMQFRIANAVSSGNLPANQSTRARRSPATPRPTGSAPPRRPRA
jgi:hypothetical protein